jgi:hypothetical protein
VAAIYGCGRLFPIALGESPPRTNRFAAPDGCRRNSARGCNCAGFNPTASKFFHSNQWVIVHTTGNGVKSAMDTPVTAQGTFHVGAQRENGSLPGIYQIDLDQLKIPNN